MTNATIELNYGPFNEGFIAHGNAEPVEANPFPVGTEDHREWYLGWCDSAEQDVWDGGEFANNDPGRERFGY